MRRIIFLDIDGVMNTYDTDLLDDTFNPTSVLALQQVIKAVSPLFVVSSARRYGGRTKIERLFETNGISLNLHDDWSTPILSTMFDYRKQEILTWLDKHTPQQWLVVDDKLVDVGTHLYQVNGNVGLTTTDGHNIVQFFQ